MSRRRRKTRSAKPSFDYSTTKRDAPISRSARIAVQWIILFGKRRSQRFSLPTIARSELAHARKLRMLAEHQRDGLAHSAVGLEPACSVVAVSGTSNPTGVAHVEVQSFRTLE